MKLTAWMRFWGFAIRKEADAAAFTKWQRIVPPWRQKDFKELAKMEEEHKKKLEGFDLKRSADEIEKDPRLGLSEMMEDVPFSSDMSYTELLLMAIKNEEKSSAPLPDDRKEVTEPSLKKLLLILAQRGSTHKEKLEKIIWRNF